MLSSCTYVSSSFLFPPWCSVRANIEKQIALIARGEAAYAAVLAKAVEEFSAKFQFFVQNVSAMDELFEVTNNISR